MQVAVAQDQDDTSEDDEALEQLFITGSRIARSALTAPTPLVVLDSADISIGGEINISEFINQLPAAGVPDISRTNSNFFNNASGLATIDLRSLGIERTLILVNGRRFVGGVPGTPAVDLNAIPTEMIERAEVITGGASAVYGSDAVSGVVNFILKDDFEGFQASARFGVSDEGDNEETDVSLMAGGNFADGKGNAIAFIGYTNQKAVFSRDRERTELDALTPFFFGGGPFGQERPFRSSFPPQGRFDVNGTGSTGDDFTFNANGQLQPCFSTNGGTAPATCGAFAGQEIGPDGFNRMDFRTIALPTERFLFASSINYEFIENVNFFLEGTYSKVETQSELEPFPLAADDIFPVAGGLPLFYQDSGGNMINNPFVPQEILDAAMASGVQSIFFTRRMREFGPRGAFNNRQTFRFSTGFEGTIEDFGVDWDLAFTYGQSTQAQISQGQQDIQALRQALLSEPDPDNPGQVRCVDAESRALGCVPINIFGAGAVTQEALAFTSADQSRIAVIEQVVVQGNVTGEIVELPGGPLAFAAGFEYRDESSDARNDALTTRGLNTSNAIPGVSGSFDVVEGYIELNAPLITDGAVDYLGISGAVRVSDYSTVGSITTYQGRAEFAPVEDILFRGSYSRAVRAPNVDELFDPGGETFAGVTDPCDGVTAATTGTIAENCRQDPGIAARIAAFGAFTLTQPEIQGTGGFIGGNPNLQEERADTFTVGAVINPGFLPSGLDASLTIDYFNIDVQNAIFAVSRQSTLELCLSDPNFPNNPLCNNIVRFPVGNLQQGALDEVNSGEANVGRLETDGIDISLRMALDADYANIPLPGRFTMRAGYTYLLGFDITNLPGEDPDREDGEIGDAKHQFNIDWRYIDDRWTFSWQLRYIGRSRIEDQDFSDEDCAGFDPGACFTGAEIYNDIQIRYLLPEFLGGSSVELFAGVENLFNNDPPVISSPLSDQVTGAETAADVYDAIGRRFYGGVVARF